MSAFALGWRPCVAALATWLVITLLVPAQAPAADDEVVTKMSAGKIERILNSLNEIKNFKELENGAYVFEAAGFKAIIFNRGETLQLFARFGGKASLARINEWNRTKRFTRAYTNEKGEPCLEADLELTGGVTEKNVKEWMRTYLVCVKKFKSHLEE